jgi:tetratricopeptide (TPR) repeat protein
MRVKALWAFFLMSGLLIAQDEEEKKPFEVGMVIDDSVADLEAPQWYPEIVSWQPAITAKNDEVQKHVHHGMALIHGGWDFEAYRHFVEAAKMDPECAMAYWGISLSLANPNAEMKEERMASLDRMLDLVRAGKTTQLEQGQIEALAFLFSEEPEKAPKVYGMVAEEFPNNLQLALMAAFMKRDGYDALLGAGAGQTEAVAEVAELVEKNPESQMALSFWVALHAEHPDGSKQIRGEVLPRVRKLVAEAPEFPPYRELLGHFEFRSGNLHLARREFSEAARLYEEYLDAEGLEYYDCPNLIRARLYLATVARNLGEDVEALAIAESLSSLAIDDERLRSPGATLLLWEGKTLGARLYLAKAERGDFESGIQTLPAKDEGEALGRKSPAVMAWEAWRQILSARKAIAEKEWKNVETYLTALAASDSLLESAGPVVLQGSGRQEWARTRQALKVEWMLAKAAIKTASGGEAGDGQASFWLRSAVDEQVPPRGIFPPILLVSPRLALAEYEAKTGKADSAREAYRAAMKASPNSVPVLKAFARFHESVGDEEAAAELRKHIEVVTTPPE